MMPTVADYIGGASATLEYVDSQVMSSQVNIVQIKEDLARRKRRFVKNSQRELKVAEDYLDRVA